MPHEVDRGRGTPTSGQAPDRGSNSSSRTNLMAKLGGVNRKSSKASEEREKGAGRPSIMVIPEFMHQGPDTAPANISYISLSRARYEVAVLKILSPMFRQPCSCAYPLKCELFCRIFSLRANTLYLPTVCLSIIYL